VLKLNDLITQATDKARDRLREAELGADLDEATFEDTAHKVAIAALKFADLSNSRTTSYVFDLDRFMSFEGKTGPYLLYQVVRIKSLLRRAGEQGARAGRVAISEPAERDLPEEHHQQQPGRVPQRSHLQLRGAARQPGQRRQRPGLRGRWRWRGWRRRRLCDRADVGAGTWGASSGTRVTRPHEGAV
jgi:hypothetical protein